MKQIFLFLSFIVISISACGQQKEYRYADWVNQTIDSTCQVRHIPAVALSIFKDHKLAYTTSRGYRDRVDSIPITDHSIFQIASLSKMVTGIIANSLEVDGIISLQDPIYKHIGQFLDVHQKEILEGIKIKHLLQHSAGIPSEMCSVYREWQKEKFWTKGYASEELRKDISKIELDFEPGLKYSYSSSGYALLTYVLEEASGLSYSALLNKYVSKRYDLPNTTATLSSDQRNKLLTTPYRPIDRSLATRDSNWGLGISASGIYSNITDLTKLMEIQMSDYRNYYETGQRTPLILTDHPDADNETSMTGKVRYNYGLGLFKYILENGDIAHQHDGDSDGYGVTYYFLPVEGRGFIAMTSACGSDFQRMYIQIGDKINGTE